ncbi:MAG: hypothetical protein SGJ10_07980 [Bacteroidota bacterium]|nr:hypothetical protein [Bacteroidota bacterium]
MIKSFSKNCVLIIMLLYGISLRAQDFELPTNNQIKELKIKKVARLMSGIYIDTANEWNYVTYYDIEGKRILDIVCYFDTTHKMHVDTLHYYVYDGDLLIRDSMRRFWGDTQFNANLNHYYYYNKKKQLIKIIYYNNRATTKYKYYGNYKVKAIKNYKAGRAYHLTSEYEYNLDRTIKSVVYSYTTYVLRYLYGYNYEKLVTKVCLINTGKESLLSYIQKYSYNEYGQIRHIDIIRIERNTSLEENIDFTYYSNGLIKSKQIIPRSESIIYALTNMNFIDRF